MTSHEDDIVAIIVALGAITFTIFPVMGDLVLKANRQKGQAFACYAVDYFELNLRNTTQATLQTQINSVLACSTNHVGGYNTSNPAGKYCYWINIIPKGPIGSAQYDRYTAKLEVEARYLL
jgi:hypothetical protein